MIADFSDAAGFEDAVPCRRNCLRYGRVFWGPAVQIGDGIRRLNGLLIDESLTGLGIEVSAVAAFLVGDVVAIHDGKLQRQARVAFVDESQDPIARIGVEFLPQFGY